MTRSEYVENFKIPVRDFYEDTGFDFSKFDFREIGEKFARLYGARRFGCPLTFGFNGAARALSEAGVGQSVLSAYENGLLNEALRHYGLDGFFSRIDGLDNIDAGSKKELGVRHAASLKTPPEKIVMVGDTPHDKEVARRDGHRRALVAAGTRRAGGSKSSAFPCSKIPRSSARRFSAEGFEPPAVSGDISARETAARFQKNCYFLSLLAAMSVSFAVDSLNCFRHSPSSSAKFEPSEDFSPRRDDASADRAAFLSGADFGIFASVSESFSPDFTISSFATLTSSPQADTSVSLILETALSRFSRVAYFLQKALGSLGISPTFSRRFRICEYSFAASVSATEAFMASEFIRLLKKPSAERSATGAKTKAAAAGRYCDFCFHN